MEANIIITRKEGKDQYERKIRSKVEEGKRRPMKKERKNWRIRRRGGGRGYGDKRKEKEK
jgi:hypothetical protein